MSTGIGAVEWEAFNGVHEGRVNGTLVALVRPGTTRPGWTWAVLPAAAIGTADTPEAARRLAGDAWGAWIAPETPT